LSENLSRRNFLRGSANKRTPLRPPWARPEAEFKKLCTGCNDCVEACPENIIFDRGGLPQISFRDGYCTFCGDCVKACDVGAFVAEAGCDNLSSCSAWSLRAHFDHRCIAANGTECRICGEQCEVGAIRFKPRRGGPPIPTIDAATCTGCGACVGPCPTGAIEVSGKGMGEPR